MVAHKTEAGFTIVELIVALVVLSLFLTMFFQLFLTSSSQRVALTRRSTANDVAASNLLKYPTISSLPATGLYAGATANVACDSTASSTNPNNLRYNPNAGVDISSANTLNPGVAPLNPQTTTVKVYVLWPRDCGSNAPAEIKSSVTFDGPNGQETITRATYIN